MNEYRFIEAPQGVWRVQQKSWFKWRTLVFNGNNTACWRDLPAYALAVPMLRPGDHWKFDSEDAARAALTKAREAMAYRKVVPE